MTENNIVELTETTEMSNISNDPHISFDNQDINKENINNVQNIRKVSLSNLEDVYKPQQRLVIVIADKIYDVTEFSDEHPGGRAILEEHLYKDCTIAFSDVGHSEVAKREMEKYEIGVIDYSMNNEENNDENNDDKNNDESYNPKTDNCATLNLGPTGEDLKQATISAVVSAICYYFTGDMYLSSIPALLYIFYLMFGLEITEYLSKKSELNSRKLKKLD